MTPPVKKYEIGSIRIEDKDHNDVFDPKVDEIKNTLGQGLRPDSSEVKKVLSQMGVKSMNGLRLSSATTFFYTLREAESLAKNGSPEELELYVLAQLRTSSSEMKISFPKDREEKILKQAYQNGLAWALRAAGTFADLGDIDRADLWVAKASSYSSKLEKDYGVKPAFDQAEARKILLKALPKAMENSFRSAEGIQDQSDPVPFVIEQLKKAEQYASLAGIPFDFERAENLLRLALAKGVEFHLDAAEEDLFKGRIPESALSIVGQYLQQGAPSDIERFSLLRRYVLLDRQILQERNEWEAYGDLGRFFRLNELMKAQLRLGEYIQNQSSLRKAVLGGEVEQLKNLFQNAEAIALDLRDSYQIDVEFKLDRCWKTFDLALANRLEKDFKAARDLALFGDVEQTQDFLYDLRDRTIEWGVEFDEARSESILMEAYTNRLENTYREAGVAAYYGDKKTYGEALKKAEGYSKELGIPFNKKRAQEIRKSMVPLGSGWSQPMIEVPTKNRRIELNIRTP